jgi:hypothetical protein
MENMICCAITYLLLVASFSKSNDLKMSPIALYYLHSRSAQNMKSSYIPYYAKGKRLYGKRDRFTIFTVAHFF